MYGRKTLDKSGASNSIASKTGDDLNLGLYFTAGIISFVGVMIYLNKKHKYYKKMEIF